MRKGGSINISSTIRAAVTATASAQRQQHWSNRRHRRLRPRRRRTVAMAPCTYITLPRAFGIGGRWCNAQCFKRFAQCARPNCKILVKPPCTTTVLAFALVLYATARYPGLCQYCIGRWLPLLLSFADVLSHPRHRLCIAVMIALAT